MSTNDDAKKPAGTVRVPIVLQQIGENFDRKKFAEAVGDGVVRIVNEERARKGLPPLKP